MKILVIILCFLIGTQLVFGQEAKPLPAQPPIQQKSDCAAVTQRMMEQYYTVEKQAQVQDSPVELACLNYLCAQSYEFLPGEAVLRSQKILFNVQKYQHLRHPTLRIPVYDEVSGLKVTLYSWNEVEAALAKIRETYRSTSGTVQKTAAAEIK